MFYVLLYWLVFYVFIACVLCLALLACVSYVYGVCFMCLWLVFYAPPLPTTLVCMCGHPDKASDVVEGQHRLSLFTCVVVKINL